MIAKFRRAQNPFVPGGFALGIRSHAMRAAQVNMFAAVKIVRRLLPGKFYHHVEPFAKIMNSHKVESAFGKTSLCFARVGDGLRRLRIRRQSTRRHAHGI